MMTKLDIESMRALTVIAETGDYAVRWNVYYYTKDIRNLLRTRQSLLELILKQSRESGIELATPMRHRLENAVKDDP